MKESELIRTHQKLIKTQQKPTRNLPGTNQNHAILVHSLSVPSRFWLVPMGSGGFTGYESQWMKSLSVKIILISFSGTHQKPIKTHQELTKNQSEPHNSDHFQVDSWWIPGRFWWVLGLFLVDSCQILISSWSFLGSSSRFTFLNVIY